MLRYSQVQGSMSIVAVLILLVDIQIITESSLEISLNGCEYLMRFEGEDDLWSSCSDEEIYLH